MKNLDPPTPKLITCISINIPNLLNMIKYQFNRLIIIYFFLKYSCIKNGLSKAKHTASTCTYSQYVTDIYFIESKSCNKSNCSHKIKTG